MWQGPTVCGRVPFISQLLLNLPPHPAPPAATAAAYCVQLTASKPGIRVASRGSNCADAAAVGAVILTQADVYPCIASSTA